MLVTIRISTCDRVCLSPPSFEFRHSAGRSSRRQGLARSSCDVIVHKLRFQPWEGPLPTSSWRKPIVGPPERPLAELRVVTELEAQGWAAAWVFRPGKFLSSWEPRCLASLPTEALELHSRIGNRAGKAAGCWDVFGWRSGRPLFAELKRAGSSDRIRPTQLRWLEAALEEGLSVSDFVIVEWMVGTSGRIGVK